MKKKADEAESCFLSGLNCAQAVFTSYSTQLGLEREVALKLAVPFGAGMSRTGEVCGAVSGAVLLIGLKHGMDKDGSYALVQEFSRRFKTLYGSVKCKDLLGYDVSIPAELKKVQEEGIGARVCPKYVRSAVEIIGDIFSEETD